MALAVQQHVSQSTSGTGVNAKAFGSNVLGAGSALWAFVFWNSASATMSVADNHNGAWSALGSPQVGQASLAAWRMQFFEQLVPAAAATTVTATESSGTDEIGMAIVEVSGFTGTPTSTGTPAYNNAASDISGNSTTPGITTTIATAAVLAAVVAATNEVSVAAPFTTIVDNDANLGGNGYARDFVSATTSGLSAVFAISSSGVDCIAGICAIGDQPGGGGGLPYGADKIHSVQQAVNRGVTTFCMGSKWARRGRLWIPKPTAITAV